MPTRRTPTSEARRAAALYKRFTGDGETVVQSIDVDPLPVAVAVIGTCDGLLYTTVRDGKTERYIHQFKPPDRPIFAVSPDGKQILLVGGRYRFGARGIVDKTDPSNRGKS